MPGQGRLGDSANVAADAHGCPGCPHAGTGPGIQGSPDVFVNGRPALRVGDHGIHAVCCGGLMWTAQSGSPTVFINGQPAFRLNDPSVHCGGPGQLIEGSTDVILDEGPSGGGGGGGGGSGAAPAGANGSGGGGALSSMFAPAFAAPSEGGSASAAAAPTSDAPAPAATDDTPTGADDDRPIDEDQIEILVVNVNGTPQPNIEYELTLPDGSKRTGRTAADGFIRLSHLTQRGDCTLDFPDLIPPSQS
jgi:uncharacterized Zn-binding protein involved in type VI secretion